jgi:hypothetical protein
VTLVCPPDLLEHAAHPPRLDPDYGGADGAKRAVTVVVRQARYPIIEGMTPCITNAEVAFSAEA